MSESDVDQSEPYGVEDVYLVGVMVEGKPVFDQPGNTPMDLVTAQAMIAALNPKWDAPWRIFAIPSIMEI